jgi:hypothetical protein
MTYLQKLQTKVILAFIALFYSLNVFAQFPIQGTWTNNARNAQNQFRIAREIRINNDNLSSAEIFNADYQHVRILDNQWTYPANVSFGANGYIKWSPTVLYSWDALNERHIVAVPTGTRRYVRPGINREVRENWYIAFAFRKDPNSSKKLIIEMREVNTFGTVSGTPAIQPITSAVGLWNSPTGSFQDQVTFDAVGSASTSPIVESNLTNITSPNWNNDIASGGTVNLAGRNSSTMLGGIVNSLDPTKSRIRIQFTGVETLTADNETCNGQAQTFYQNKAEYLGMVEAWLATSSSCARPSSSASQFGIVINRPAGRGLSNVLVLSPGQKQNLSLSRELTIPSGQFGNARLVLGGNLSEINPCPATEMGYNLKSILMQSGSCVSILLSSLKIGENSIEIGNNNDRVRIYFTVSQS